VFLAGSSDRVFVTFGLSYTGQLWFWRVALVVLPVLVWVVTRRVCEELRAEQPPPEEVGRPAEPAGRPLR
jgi:hypothetical protein